MYLHFSSKKLFTYFIIVILQCKSMIVLCEGEGKGCVSAVGDPGMKRDGLRLGLESWNQCNEVGEEAPHMGSPRVADCFDLYKASPLKNGNKKCSLCDAMPYAIVHRVTEEDNKLGNGQPFPGQNPRTTTLLTNVDLYAPTKELYLASKCQVQDTPTPWHFWMIMLKNGNFDLTTSSCPANGVRVKPQPDPSNSVFPCFGKGCMNHPLIEHNYTTLHNTTTLRGSLSGSWDLGAPFGFGSSRNGNGSYYSVSWEKEVGQGSWVFHHVLRTSQKYPWLMLYLRADATYGFSGGYHYPSRGILKIVPESPNFKVTFELNVIQGGGPMSQFYLLDIGSCWKNNGQPCDGNVTSDVTRYSEMILNPSTPNWCTPESLGSCPPYHTFPNGSRVHRNDTSHFPYEAYHIYCAPGNAEFVEEPISYCDPFSNPQPQEIVQILPHPVWGEYGYPTKRGDGWIGDPRTWELDAGRLSELLYFYQDPGTPAAKRQWTSINLGTEIFKAPNQVAEWTVTNFDVLVPEQ